MSQKYPSTCGDRQTAVEILIGIGVGLSVGLAMIYALLLRPRMLQWGASSQEQAMSLPGDAPVS